MAEGLFALAPPLVSWRFPLTHLRSSGASRSQHLPSAFPSAGNCTTMAALAPQTFAKVAVRAAVPKVAVKPMALAAPRASVRCELAAGG